MSAPTLQKCLALVFFILGGWALVAPAMVLELTVNEAYRSGSFAEVFAIGCFGAQACISGLFAWFSTFTKRTFAAYGIGLLPFFAFNYYFYAVEPVLTEVGLLDLVGNIVMLALCWLGYRRAPRAVRVHSQ
ncbi:hypothetical protein [Sphingomicrobium nitratireducens]|uniref:hypothetical protein n=1 Tax=Sphingomicrobium nitratireducens TaxID=2964666 RepID=UPI00223FC650|nr:hypothetical protein [Sphingomicrobium nitratireducens]